LFEQVGIKLVHGWVVDPDSEEAYAVGKTADYDSAVNLIAEADHTTNGHLVLSEDCFGAGGSVPNGHAPKTLTEEERDKVTRGTVINSQHEPTSQCSCPSHHSHHSQHLPAQHPIPTNLPRPLHARIHPPTRPTRRPLPQLSPLGPVQIQRRRFVIVHPRFGPRVPPRTVSGLGMSRRHRRRLVNVCRFGFCPFDSRWG
jgi:hypothetical protein